MTWRGTSSRAYREVGEEARVLLNVAEGHAVGVALFAGAHKNGLDTNGTAP